MYLSDLWYAAMQRKAFSWREIARVNKWQPVSQAGWLLVMMNVHVFMRNIPNADIYKRRKDEMAKVMTIGSW